MTRKDIITLPNPLLRKRSQRVAIVDKDALALTKGMVAATLDWEKHRKNEVGVALAAVQVGQTVRAVVVRADLKDKDNRDFKIFFNPEIVKHEGDPVKAPEGCLSVKDVYGLVPRYPKIKLKALDASGHPIRLTASGFMARIFQHEIDHTHGKLFIDHVKDKQFFLLGEEGKLLPLNEAEIKKRGLLTSTISHT
jgi:peptide deformylase